MKTKFNKLVALGKYTKNNPHLVKKFFLEVQENGISHSLKKLKLRLNIENSISEKVLQSTQDCIDENNIPRIEFDSTNEGHTSYIKHESLKSMVKTVAFYLPQFHPFPENDEWWGKGFTEWTNVTKATRNFVGHYQPHLPIHSGFYDLRIPEVMIEQAKLAKNYGIHGFNFYYYWFDGKILMHKPFEILLRHKEIDINFCITWANENWTRRWDGQENDVLIAQNHCKEDSEKFIESLYQYFEDERYIRIDNKPVLIIYRADIIPNMKETIQLWRAKARNAGFDGLYLICSQTFGISSPDVHGFDAAMEFPPHTVRSMVINNEVELINQDYKGLVFDYNHVVDNACKVIEPEYKLFRTSMLSWDNTARKQNGSNIFYHFSLLKYKQWFANTVYSVLNNPKYAQDEKLVFINAWNEWAEGTHLEPDRKYGYGYLQTTYDVLKNLDSKYCKILEPLPYIKKNPIAVILHIHYTDVWENISYYLSNLDPFGFDLYITLTNIEDSIIEKIMKIYPEAHIKLVENRGRDILPFIDVFRDIYSLDYLYICKLHTKKSIYRNDGEKLRNELYNSLLGNETIIRNILSIFDNNNSIGLLCGQKYLLHHSDYNLTYNKKIVDELSKILKFEFEYFMFPAGSMFWFRPVALKNIASIENTYFPIEKGYADGTTAHSIERLFCNITRANGFHIQAVD